MRKGFSTSYYLPPDVAEKVASLAEETVRTKSAIVTLAIRELAASIEDLDRRLVAAEREADRLDNRRRARDRNGR